MNRDHFFQQLEQAIEERDHAAIRSLKSASQLDDEQRAACEQHDLLNSAIEVWCAPAAAPPLQKPDARRTPSFSSRLLMAGLAVLLSVGMVRIFSPTPDESQIAQQSEQELDPVPAFESSDDLLETRNELAVARQEMSQSDWSETLAIAELKAPVSVVSQVGTDVTRGMASAWTALSRLPVDVEDVMKDIQQIVPQVEEMPVDPEEKPAPENSWLQIFS
ncbi:MAG: hypothetical protein KDA78_15890 [Planctomycetaceae bacterium]|nr:hypothetical protein [Planctomycetaceae bacterium]